MAWIEAHQNLKEHPKLYAVCRTLSAKREHMVGHLMCLWWWCIDYAMDGDISKYNATHIAMASGWDQDAEKYLEALINGGFIDKSDKSMQIHDWLDFCGDLILKRLERLSGKRHRTGSIVCRTTANGALPILSNLSNQPTKVSSRSVKPTACSRFVKPTSFEIGEYAESIGFNLNGQEFFDFYESKGWVVGRSPMKDWKAAVRTWKKRDSENKGAEHSWEDKAVLEAKRKLKEKEDAVK